MIGTTLICHAMDGLTAAWYKIFWPKIKDLVYNSFVEAFTTGQLSASQRKGIIRLIYKNKGPRNELANWRPISLTNTDYKLIAKVLASRLKQVISTIIHEDQNGYIKGRNPALLIRAIDDIIEYTDHMHSPGALLSLDYSKAYDTISKEFFLTAFKKFGFGRNYVRWVSVINQNSMSCINYCGWLSDWFMLERGIRQGCPFSPLCFIIAVEILSCKVRQMQVIKGIELPFDNEMKEIKFLQYADDSTILVRDEESIFETLNIIEQFSVFSGLKLNRNKTQAIWMGCWKYKRKEIANVKWNTYPDNKIKILGIYFKSDQQIHEITKNWEPKFTKCENIIKTWTHRNLTIAGKILLVKSFLMNQFLYLMQATFVPKVLLNRINSLLFKYIWSKHNVFKEAELQSTTERIKRDIIIQDYENGGLNMINIEHMQTVNTIKWVNKIIQPGNGSWRILPKYYLTKLSPRLTVFKSEIQWNKFRGKNIKLPHFYTSLLENWFNIPNANTHHTIDNSAQILWNNNKITYRGNSLFLQRWINKGITYVSDVMTATGIIDYNKVLMHVNDSAITRYEFNVIYNALKQFEGSHISDIKDDTIFLNNKALSEWNNQDIRKLLKNHCSKDIICKWANIFNDNRIQHDNKIWTRIPLITNETKLIVLQWKILHHIFPSNSFLHKIGKVQTNECIYCQEIETIQHLFFECPHNKTLWADIEKIISLETGNNIKITSKQAILGISDYELSQQGFAESANKLIILGKYCINKVRFGQQTNLKIVFEYERTIRKW